MSAYRAVKRRAVGLAARAGEFGLSAMGVRPPSALLVLGHMRSGSTLLLHLLLTNPEISAMGERNARYTTEADLSRLAITVRWRRRLPFGALRFVADQVNHSRFTPNRALLCHPRVWLLFLLRRPADSLASLLELTRTHYQGWSVERAVDYYVERLTTLGDYGQSCDGGGRAALVTYEDLIDHPADTLEDLRSFLGTQAGFSERYQVHEFTGARGDPGPKIRTGRIGRPSSTSASASIDRVELPAWARARSEEAYDRCRKLLGRLALRPSSP